MSITTTGEMATAVRAARRRCSWTQAQLASRIGVTREWVIKLEHGAPRLEFDKVLLAATALGIKITSPVEEATAADRDRADEIAWDMALEGRPLSAQGQRDLLEKVVSERLLRESPADRPLNA